MSREKNLLLNILTIIIYLNDFLKNTGGRAAVFAVNSFKSVPECNSNFEYSVVNKTTRSYLSAVTFPSIVLNLVNIP